MTTHTNDIADIKSRLDLAHIDMRGRTAGHMLRTHGIATESISPGDLTAYGFVLIDQRRTTSVVRGCRFAMGSTYGRIGGLPDNLASLDPGHIADGFIEPRFANLHTSVVYQLFLQAVARGWES